MQADGYELLYRLQSQLTPTRYAVDPLFASRKEGEERGNKLPSFRLRRERLGAMSLS